MAEPAVTPVVFHRTFVKHFTRRISSNARLREQFNKRYALFIEDRTNPLLQDYKLTSMMAKLRAFSVTGDIRVIYRFLPDGTIEFLDIGTHNQVYK